MPYARKEKNSFILYHSYKEQFDLLNDKQLRDLIYAMIEFDKTGNELELDNLTKMAFTPIKRNLLENKERWEDRCNKNSENIKKRWEKVNNTNGIQSYTNEYERIRKDTKYTDNDNDNDNDNEYDNESERENIKRESIQSKVANAPAPTLSEIVSFGEEKGLNNEYCEKFYNYYEGIGWKNGNGLIIKNWKNVFNNWIKKDTKEGKIKESKEYIGVDGFKYKNGRRQF